MPHWLFNIYKDGAVREVYRRTQGSGVTVNNRHQRGWLLSYPLLVGDMALLAELTELLQGLLTEFEWACERWKLRVSVEESLVMVVGSEPVAPRKDFDMSGEFTHMA